jgi:hypothetical protein
MDLHITLKDRKVQNQSISVYCQTISQYIYIRNHINRIVLEKYIKQEMNKTPLSLVK